jgi:prophage regulatory protein
MNNFKVLRLAQVEDMSGLRRSQLYKLLKEGRFPKQLKLMGRNSGWLLSEVEAWISDRVSERNAAGENK